ncbi:MAG: hypothetical protein JNJ98_12910, partial [Gemmatimonadetes bacterium]|nr:hypothetical protein [Gemmatimonadota bacterium]
MSRSTRTPLIAFCGAALVASALACSERASEAPAAPSSLEAKAEYVDAGPAVASRMAAPSDMAAAPAPAQGSQLPTVRGQDSVAPNMIIRNGNVMIEVDSLELAIDAVRKLAASLGGYVGNVSTS